MMNPTDDFLDPDLSAMLDSELSKGERVTWVGRPIPWLMARSVLPVALMGIPFTAFAVFWIAVASGFRFPHFSTWGSLFPLFGVPFVCVGLGMLLSPIWTYRRATRTIYAITDRRALTIETDPLGRVTTHSFEPPHLTIVTRMQRADGTGNLVFRREHRGAGRNHRMVDIGFLAVADVREVEDHIRQLIARSDPPGSTRRWEKIG
jgi:hypothetical protein